MKWGKYFQYDSSRTAKEQPKTLQRIIHEIPEWLWSFGRLVIQIIAAAHIRCTIQAVLAHLEPAVSQPASA